MDASTLIGCPWCKDLFEQQLSVRFDEDRAQNDRYFVLCNNCGADGPSARTEDEAATLWNSRCGTDGPDLQCRQDVTRDELESLVAGALFDFAGGLSIGDTLVCGRFHDASLVCEALNKFLAQRGISYQRADVGNWNNKIHGQTDEQAEQREEISSGTDDRVRLIAEIRKRLPKALGIAANIYAYNASMVEEILTELERGK